jgi:hypothetical protein
MKSKLILSSIVVLISIASELQAQLYFGPSVTHTSSREWNINSDEYTANDLNFMLRYQFKNTLATRFEISSILRQGSGRTTEFIRFPLIFEFEVEDMKIDNRELWRLYFATGGYFAFPTNSTDENVIDFYNFGVIGEVGLSFNFSRGAYATVGYRTSVDFESIARNASASPQRFADSGIYLGFAMPFSIFSHKNSPKQAKDEYVN